MTQALDLLANPPPGKTLNWLDQLQMASFRGVPFQVDTIEWTAGDNVVIREYPFQDLPTVFRMGRGAEYLRFSAYVIGTDYHLQRDALMSALSGEGTLMHPTAGALHVTVAGQYTVREAPTAEGGMARFDLVFLLADHRRYPVEGPSTRTQATTAAQAGKQAAQEAFAASWSLAGAPGWVAANAVERLRATLEPTYSRLAAVSAQLGAFNSSQIASMQALRGGLESLVAKPRQLAANIATLFELPSEMTTATARAFQSAFAWAFDLGAAVPLRAFEVSTISAGLAMYGAGQGAPLQVATSAKRQQAALQTASDGLLQTLATAAWIEAAAQAELANYDEALALRATVHTQCLRLAQTASTEAPTSAQPTTHLPEAIAAMHTAALADLQARSRDLVRLSTYTPGVWEPALVISHRLFGTAQWADEILAMNPHIEHPLLAPPGRELRIIRHE